MKKFWLGLLSTIVLLGGSLAFTACGSSKLSIELNETHMEICINDDTEKSAVVVAKVNGTNNGTVSVSSNYTDVAIATAEYSTVVGGNVITIKAVGSTGSAEILVTSNDDPKVSSIISVTVYNRTTSISQNPDKSHAYLLRGKENELNANLLVKKEPAQDARGDVTWRLHPDFESDLLTLEGDSLVVDKEYAKSSVKLVASVNGVEDAEIELEVIDSLGLAGKIQTSYTSNNFTDLDKDKPIQIVSNIAQDDFYTAYVKLTMPTLANMLHPTPYINDKESNDELSVRLYNTNVVGDNTEFIYEIRAKNHYVNNVFDVYFKLSYPDYSYSVTTETFRVSSFEKIESVKLLDENGKIVTAEDIYTSYEFTYGAKHSIQFTPNIPTATKKYIITVDYTGVAGSSMSEVSENALQFYYPTTNGGFAQVDLNPAGENIYTSEEVSSSTLYILAGVNNPLRNAKVTFVSVENEFAKADCTFNLFPTTSSLNFGTGYDVKLNSTNGNEVSFPAGQGNNFTLEGESDTNRLSVETEGKGFTAKISETGSDAIKKSVNFKVVFQVNQEDLNTTGSGRYRIVHKNGMVSQWYNVSLYVPMSDITLSFENSNGGVTKYLPTNENPNAVGAFGGLYIVNGNVLEAVEDASQTIEYLLIRSGFNVELLFNTNNANVIRNYKFLDYNSEEFTEEGYNALTAQEIYGNAKRSSNILSMNGDNILTSSKTGFTYLVIELNGQDSTGANQTYVRIVRIQNYVAPSEFTLNPNNVDVYASNSVDSVKETTCDVAMHLSDIPLTFNKIDYLTFLSSKMGEGKIAKEYEIDEENSVYSVTWVNGNYKITNLRLYDTYITFTVTGLTTSGASTFDDLLTISYHNVDLEDRIYLNNTLYVNVKNADRIENLKLETSLPNDELYFSVNDTTPSVLLFSHSPTNAKNGKFDFILTDGTNLQNYLTIQQSGEEVYLSVNSTIGATGYLYVLPADAVNDNSIAYYLEGDNALKFISRLELHSKYQDADFMEKAYFINNKEKHIYFKDIIVRINVTVADGETEDRAYHIYSESGLQNVQQGKWYKVMNDITLNDWQGVKTQIAGIKGNTEDVTITIKSGNAFVDRNSGVIKNLRFTGSVTGNGFVANTNNGIIENVEVDVISSGTQMQSSSVTGDIAGGLVGVNSGSIRDVKVLGVTVSGNLVGGIVGSMEGGSIENARYEIYNFANGANSLSGTIVGGVIGQYDNGTINKVYAYDYAMTSDSNNLVGTTVGAIIGEVSGAITPSINYSFAVVNNVNIVGSGSAKLEDVYNSYYNSSDSYQSEIENINAENWASSETWVNGGKEYLKDFHQDKPVDSVEGFKISESDIKKGNYYQALRVSEDTALLFNYSLSTLDYLSMNDSEKAALNEFNTIKLSALFGDKSMDGLVVLSSDSSIVSISGENLVINRNGEVTLTLSSKHDFTKSKPFTIKVIYAITDITVGLVEVNGQAVHEGSDVHLQKGKSLTVDLGFESRKLSLGNSGNEFTFLASDNYTFNYQSTSNEETNKVVLQPAGRSTVVLIASSSSVDTVVNMWLKMTDLNDRYNNKIRETFFRNFKVVPFEGGLNLTFSNEDIAVTPSRSGYVRADLTTNNENDSLTPSVRITSNKVELSVRKESEDIWIASIAGEDRLKIQISEQDSSQSNGVYSKEYSIVINVADDYRGKVSEDEHYSINFSSASQILSGDVDIVVSKQSFTNVDITNYKVNRLIIDTVNGVANVTKYETLPSPTGVISPGNSSILKLNVNPSFAYYDHVTVNYDINNSSTINMATIKYMQKLSNSVYYEDDGATKHDNGVLVRPQDRSQDLYFKVWANTTIKQDTTLIITATFYDKNNKEITHVNYFLLVSYFVEPTVLIDGEEMSTLAKGQSAEIKVIVPRDCTVDINSVAPDTSAVSGVNILRSWTESEDALTGARTYTSTIYASVTSELIGKNEYFTVPVNITRNINGGQEVKQKSATVGLVDFKIDTQEDIINLNIDGVEGDTFTTYYGVYQTLKFNYPILPETLVYDKSDEESVEAAKKIEDARKFFTDNAYYNKDEYYINYDIKNDRPKTIAQNLSYQQSDGQWIDILAENGTFRSAGGYLEWSYTGGNSISVKGLTLSSGSEPIRMKLETTIKTAGMDEKVCNYYFNIIVKTYSDEDVPIIINNSDDFMNMSTGDAQDYILMSDIILNDFEPFDTTYINSLDGNGYTIYINSFNPYPDGSELNYALFKNVTNNTTLKNVRVNVYNGGQIVADISQYKRINVAGLAINNAGIITNCEVVSFQMMGKTTASISTGTGLVVKYINGRGTSTPQYLYSNEFTSSVAGFVLNNNGSITNSRVGGDYVNTVGARRSDSNGQTIGFDLIKVSQEEFNIVAQGSVSGFVIQNTGTIASSFAKNVGVSNESRGTSFITAGFVMSNGGRIATSYVQGSKGNSNTVCMTGSSISSSYGIVAGFVYQNGTSGSEASISDCYSNILISNQDNTAYLASGFVYMNDGVLTNCFSASQVSKQRYSQMNFSGVNELGDPLNRGKYNNCYYYNPGLGLNESTTESKYDTGAIKIPDFSSIDNFYGFSFNSANSENDGVWKLDSGSLELVEANNISFSNRYSLQNPDDKEKYILPYSTMYDGDSAINVSYGSVNNPIIVRNAEEFVKVTGTSTSIYISEYFTTKQVRGRYRLVNDIDFSTLATREDGTVDLPSVNKALTGRINGNAFTISGLSIASTNPTLAYGMFASIEKGGSIINLNIIVDKVENGDASFVGAIAGYVNEGILSNIDLTYNQDSIVRGLNFVGGVAGYVTGKSVIKNINITDANIEARRKVERKENETNPNVISDEYVQTLRSPIYQKIGGILVTEITQNVSAQIRESVNMLSYAGGIAGVIDTFTENERTKTQYNYQNKLTLTDYDIFGIRVLNSVKVNAQVAGGALGFSGMHTDVKDMGVEFNDSSNASVSSILATRYYAGGVIGQSYGNITQTYSQYNIDIQNGIENSYNSYYTSLQETERGSTNIFTSEGEDHPIIVGGLVGYVGSGTLTISYSKINVVNMSANYAGGLIGQVNSSSDDFSIGENDERLTGNYYIHEAYTSGDVRGGRTAGGVFGDVQNNSRVILSSVNVTNFLSLNKYDEENGVYTAEDLTYEKEVDTTKEKVVGFEKIGVYSIAGNIDNDALIQCKKDRIAIYEETEELSEPETTVGVVRAYRTSIGTITLNPYKGYEWKNKNADGVEEDKKEIFEMPMVSEFSDAANGYEETYPAFLGRWWSSDNWVHKIGKLYPNIKLSLAEPPFIYLDCFNVDDVLKAMHQSNIEVRVRGKASQDGNTYDDIDLRNWLAIKQVEGYRGKIVGLRENNLKPDGKYPSLILNGPMFNSVQTGFKMQDLTVIYRPTSDNKGMFDGNSKFHAGFVNGDIKDSIITNVTFTYVMPDNSNGITLSGDNVGLLATEIVNTSIYGFEIVIEGQSINLLNAQSVKNVGLIAGEVIQSSEESVINISRINVKDNRSKSSSKDYLINVSSVKEKTKVNIGGYFGTIRTGNEENKTYAPINLYLGHIVNNVANNAQNEVIYLNAEVDSANIGGYVGDAQSLSKVEISDDGNRKNAHLIDLEVLVNANVTTTLNAGTMFGTLSGSTTATLNNATINGGVHGTGTIGDANIGGIAGQSFIGLNITDVTIENFDVYGNQKNDFADKATKLTINEFAFNALNVTNTAAKNVTNTANIGAYVGDTSQAFTLTSTNGITLNGGIAVNAATANVGGVIGNTTGAVTIQGKIAVATYISATASDTANLGGLVGFVIGKSFTVEGSANNLIAYDGQIYTNSTANIGGVVGNFAGTADPDNTGHTISIKYTSFGGAVKVYSAGGKNIVAGGTIGTMPSDSATGIIVTNLILQNNYNYGDVFILYNDNREKLNALTFGGIVGQLSSRIDSKTVEYNYSLVTLNNQLPSSNDNVHAMFGINGAILNNGTQIPQNYYNHAVALCTDDYAIDAGYMKAYSESAETTGGGYNNEQNETKLAGKDGVFKTAGISLTENSGSKLNPQKLTDKGKLEGAEGSSNGITYYYLSENKTIDAQMAEILNNTALIGDTYKITYTANASPIGEMKGFSFVSGLLIDVEMNYDVMSKDNPYNKPYKDNVGGLVGNLTQGTLYAVGVLGEMSIGGDIKVTMGGLAGSATNAYISECFTDVHMIYRAANTGDKGSAQAAAVVGTTGNNTTISYTYAVGTVECYIDVHIDGFSIGEATVQNCYTTANLEWHDYTSDKTSSNERTVFSGATLDDSVNDVNATGIGETDGIIIEGKNKKLGGINWVNNNDFNYGYPTRKFNYLKTSSYFKRGEDNATDDEKSRGIHNYEYTRLTWLDSEVKNDGYTETYFAIPNIKVWNIFMSEDTTKSANAIIRNDIYYNYNEGEMTTSINAGSGENNIGSITLDGQGHRIYNIKHCLFVNLTDSTVINLDLLDANVTDGNALLANDITGSTIANMTLSGTLTYSDSYKMGALVGESRDSNIYSVMSNVKLDSINVVAKSEQLGNKDKADCILVGGIVGYFKGGMNSIAYCANNGPIVVSTTAGFCNVYTGGIVGYINSGTIKYSYNTNSVLGGYIDDKNSNYYTGGIAGAAWFGFGVTLNYCYNSGMIKSGNKSVGDGKISYAAGIVAYAENATVSNCINEGPVEALGKNPEWSFSGKKQKEWSAILTINSDRNVYAYGIAYANKDTKILISQNNNSSILNNGNICDKGTSEEYLIENSRDSSFVQWAEAWAHGGLFMIFQKSSYISIDNNEDVFNDNAVVTTSQDKYGMPLSFYIKMNRKVEMVPLDIISDSHERTWNAYLSYYDSDSTLSRYETRIANESGKSTNIKFDESTSFDKTKIITAVKYDFSKDKLTTISNLNFMEIYNSNAALNAMDFTYSYKVTGAEFSGLDDLLTKFGDSSNYSFYVVKKENDIFKIDSTISVVPSNIRYENGCLVCDLTLHCINELTKDQLSSLTIQCGYKFQQSTTLDMSQSNYSLDANGNLIIKIDLDNNFVEEDYDIRTILQTPDNIIIKNGTTYETFKVAIGDNVIYLYYDMGADNFIYFTQANKVGVGLVNTQNIKDIITNRDTQAILYYKRVSQSTFDASTIISQGTIKNNFVIPNVQTVIRDQGIITIGGTSVNLGTLTGDKDGVYSSDNVPDYKEFSDIGVDIKIDMSQNPEGIIYFGPMLEEPWDFVHVNNKRVNFMHTSPVSNGSRNYNYTWEQTGDIVTIRMRSEYETNHQSEAEAVINDIKSSLETSGSSLRNATVIEDWWVQKQPQTRNFSVTDGSKAELTYLGEPFAYYDGTTWTTEMSNAIINGNQISFTTKNTEWLNEVKIEIIEYAMLKYSVPINSVQNGKEISKALLHDGTSYFAKYEEGKVSLLRNSTSVNGYNMVCEIEDANVIFKVYGIAADKYEEFLTYFNSLAFTYEYKQYNLPQVSADSNYFETIQLNGLSYQWNGTFDGYNIDNDKFSIGADGNVVIDKNQLSFIEYEGLKVLTGDYAYNIFANYNLSGVNIILDKEKSKFDIAVNGSAWKGKNNGEGVEKYFDLSAVQGVINLNYVIYRTLFDLSGETKENAENSNKKLFEVMEDDYTIRFQTIQGGIKYTYDYVYINNKLNSIEILKEFSDKRQLYWNITGSQKTIQIGQNGYYLDEHGNFYEDPDFEKEIFLGEDIEVDAPINNDETNTDSKWLFNKNELTYEKLEIVEFVIDENKNINVVVDTQLTDVKMELEVENTLAESSAMITFPDLNQKIFEYNHIENNDADPEFIIEGLGDLGYEIGESKVIVYYKPLMSSSVKVTYYAHCETQVDCQPEKNDAISHYSVILRKNILANANHSMKLGNGTEKYQLNADNYTITYLAIDEGIGLFSTIESKAVIKDLHLAGVSSKKTQQEQYYLVRENKGSLKNISVYGTLILPFGDYSAAAVAHTNSGAMDNIYNYVAIMGKDQEIGTNISALPKLNAIVIDSSSGTTSQFYNRGVLLAGAGARANIVINRTSWGERTNGLNGNEGKDGNDGGDIDLNKSTNEQYIRAGAGGNAGAGINGTDGKDLYPGYGKDYYKNDMKIDLRGGNGGKAGARGNSGKITNNSESKTDKVITADSVSYAYDGNPGLPGYIFPKLVGGFAHWRVTTIDLEMNNGNDSISYWTAGHDDKNIVEKLTVVDFQRLYRWNVSLGAAIEISMKRYAPNVTADDIYISEASV